MKKPANYVDHIAVRDENAVFGVEREAGTTVYDKTNKKTYLLLKPAEKWECLASFSDKKKLVKPIDFIMTVGNIFDAYGYKRITYGTLDPMVIESYEIGTFSGDNVSDTVNVLITGSIKLFDEDSIIVTVNELSVECIWNGTYYSGSSVAIPAYLASELGNVISISITV